MSSESIDKARPDDPVGRAYATQIANIEKNTGKKLADWISIVNKSGFEKHGELVSFLKEKHGFTHGNANTVVHYAKQTHAGAEENTTDWIAEQYKGKENLKLWYDKLMQEVQAFGKDVELAPKKAYMSLRRKKQFAIIQPSTKTRLDIGLNIKGIDPSGKLEAAGSWNGMCSHRIKIEDGKAIDKELINWIRESYNQAG